MPEPNTEMHERLKSSPLGMAEEIRQRLERSFEQDAADEQTRGLLDAIDRLASWVKLQTGHAWHEHAAAHWLFRTAVTARLQRLRPPGERAFADGELPTRRSWSRQTILKQWASALRRLSFTIENR